MMKKIFHKSLASVLNSYITLMLISCTSLAPTPECINGTWSYVENIQTDIEINPDLKITLEHFIPNITTATSTSDRITIYGDRRVTYTYRFSEAGVDTSEFTVEKQITEEQLSQIVTAFEEANFYAISFGCEEGAITCTDVGRFDISIVTDGKSHSIQDQGGCSCIGFDKYCDLDDTIDKILGTPW